MSNISREHGERLYWLGRYTERFFTTIKSLERLHDKVIDRDPSHYQKYLACFGMNDTYGDYKNFFSSFIFDKNNMSSASYSLERAYDNGIVLREEISTDALAYLQLAIDKLESASKTNQGLVVTLLPLQDIVYSFWGCVNDTVTNEEVKDIINLGKYVERLELYIRLKYRPELVTKEFDRLCLIFKRIPENSPYRCNEQSLSELTVIIENYDSENNSVNDALSVIGKLFNPTKVRS